MRLTDPHTRRPRLQGAPRHSARQPQPSDVAAVGVQSHPLLVPGA